MQNSTLAHEAPSPTPLEKIVSAGIIDLALLPSDLAPTTEIGLDGELYLKLAAARSQLARLDGRSITGLSDGQRTLVARSLQILLDLEEIPDLCAASDAEGDLAKQAIRFERGQVSLARLECLRLGQPDPELMLALSPDVKECLEYVRMRFKERRPLVRLIAGEMGQGKTTLARAIQAIAREEQAIPVMLTMPRSSGFEPAGWLRDMVLDQGLLAVAFREIAETALLLGDERQATLCNCWRTAPLSLVMNTAIRHVVSNPAQYVTLAGARELARDCEAALTPWLSSSYSRVTPGREFISRYKGKGLFTGTFDARRMGPALLTDFLSFCREAGCYPVWLFDEFESVAGIKPTRQQIALGFFRDLVDVVSAEHGAVFLFSTGDGRAAIRGYSALEDRLKSPEGQATLYSPTWLTSKFAQWSPESVVEELLRIYESAAHTGNPLAQSVGEHANQIREMLKDPVIHDLLAAHDSIPRERLKGTIALLDQVHTDGMEHFEALIQEAERAELDAELDVPDDYAGPFDDIADVLQNVLQEYVESPFPPVREPIDSPSASVSSRDDVDRLDERELGRYVPPNARLGEGAPPERTTPDTEPAIPMVEKPRLNRYGLKRWELRTKLEPAEMPFLNESSRQLKGVKPTYEQLVQSSNHAYLGLRLSIFRDLSCSIEDVWEAAVGETYLELSGGNRVRLARSSSSEDTLKLQSSSMMLLSMIDRHKGSIPVAMPATRKEAEERANLAKEDRAAIRAMKKAGSNPQPFVPDAWPWPGCSVLGTIEPLDNVQVFRQVAYTWFAMDTGLVPVDEWVDQFVLETMAERFGYQPRSSRDGVEFIVTKSRLLGMFDKRRRISTESVADLSQAHSV